MIHHSAIDLLFYLLLYSFIGWTVGVACLAIKDRHFINRGFLNLPLAINEGIHGGEPSSAVSSDLGHRLHR